MPKNSRPALTIIIIAIVAIALLGWQRILSMQTSKQQGAGTDKVPCIDASRPVPDSLHIHPHLTIVINGQQQAIPAQIGLSPSCERVIHTHDATGEIHIEPNDPMTFTLGDFFNIWGKTFNQNQILDSKTDANHEIVMTVDGKQNTQFENLVLQDKQNIIIEYKTR